jgi:hypothetical protein
MGFLVLRLRTDERAQEKLGTEWNRSFPVLGFYYAPKSTGPTLPPFELLSLLVFGVASSYC